MKSRIKRRIVPFLLLALAGGLPGRAQAEGLATKDLWTDAQGRTRYPGDQIFGEWQVYPFNGTACALTRKVERHDASLEVWMMPSSQAYFHLVDRETGGRDERMVLRGQIQFDLTRVLQGPVQIRSASDRTGYKFGFIDDQALVAMAKARRAMIKAGSTVWHVALDGSSQAIQLLLDCVLGLGHA